MTNTTDWDVLPCFSSLPNSTYTRFDCYRIALVTFFGAMGPFVFFNVQKTKYLQLLTSGMRWLGKLQNCNNYFFMSKYIFLCIVLLLYICKLSLGNVLLLLLTEEGIGHIYP